jgi:hypothetical protein
MDLRLLIRARWHWSINTLEGRIPYVHTQSSFERPNPHNLNLRFNLNIILLIPMLKLKLILSVISISASVRTTDAALFAYV